LVRRVFVLITVLLTVSFLSSVGFIQQAKASPTVVTVTANPLWTNTAIYVNMGNIVTITAWDTWSPSNNLWYESDGTNVKGQYYTDEFINPANWAELIAFVGPDPYQGINFGTSFFPQPLGQGYWVIGKNQQFTSNIGGWLWLGINDDAQTKATGDNFGNIHANVTVTAGGPGPNPVPVGGYSISIEKLTPFSSFGGYIGLVALLGVMLCVTKTRRKK